MLRYSSCLSVGSRFFLLSALVPSASAATLVSLETTVGNMTIELFDAAKPNTVENFLNYVTDGRFANLFAHRLDPDFVLQSGGFTLEGNTITAVSTDPAIASEFTSDPEFSNLFGTIAMAQTSAGADSATSGWFINLGDNTFLDTSEFTVFGKVIDGLDVLAKFNTDFGDAGSGGQGVYDASGTLGPAFGELPLLSNALSENNLIFTDLTVVPEPSSLGLLIPVLGSLLLRRSRRFPVG